MYPRRIERKKAVIERYLQRLFMNRNFQLVEHGWIETVEWRAESNDHVRMKTPDAHLPGAVQLHPKSRACSAYNLRLPLPSLLFGSTAEDYRVDLTAVSILELTIDPDLGVGHAPATLADWRLA